MSLPAAARMQLTSAWAVGSVVCQTVLCVTATTSPPRTIAEPKGDCPGRDPLAGLFDRQPHEIGVGHWVTPQKPLAALRLYSLSRRAAFLDLGRSRRRISSLVAGRSSFAAEQPA